MRRARATLPFLFPVLLAFLAATPGRATAQSNDELRQMRALLERQAENLQHELDVLSRQVDDVMFFQRLGDIADIDLVTFTGPPPRHEPNPTAQGAGNPVRLHAYVFIPRNLDRSHKQPLIVFPHGGVHSNFGTGTTHVLREMLEQGYTVVAPEYRGSTGYGRGFYQEIDYGGLEIEDTYAARTFMLETYDFLDPARVGIVGWSHGGLHALMNIFEHGKDYAAAYAGVPVSDLIARMGYKTQGYRDLYSADYHIGKTAYEDGNEYRRRSPSWNTDRYDGTPLLIHTNTNDEDVNVLEVERLIQALKASGKTGFQYKIYQDAPGGHVFNRLDTPLARQSRREIWRFLAPYLKPDHPAR
ncbi:MAG TPA: alpha/beta fold hydrolase [Longimicrobiales bacterium]|nr:alpha/beta fold hydrolase [Longimicrobiales bacterium]